MSITSSGIICDVCNNYIFYGDHEQFTMSMFENLFHCHAKCKPLVEKLMKEKTYKHLPNCNLRTAFDEAEKQIGGE